MKKILFLIFLFSIYSRIDQYSSYAQLQLPDDNCTYEEIICDQNGCTKYIYYCDGRLKEVIPDWD